MTITIADPPVPLAKALVLITRTTICDCGERYSSPELYERHTPPSHWALRSILHLKRRHLMPTHQLPIERHLVVEQIPFCDTCLALGAPLAHLPLPPDPKAPLAHPGPLAPKGPLAPIVPTPAPPKAAAPRAAKHPPLWALTIDEIFGAP